MKHTLSLLLIMSMLGMASLAGGTTHSPLPPVSTSSTGAQLSLADAAGTLGAGIFGDFLTGVVCGLGIVVVASSVATADPLLLALSYSTTASTCASALGLS